MKLCAIDLFAGCGGLSEGFNNAGFDVITQVDMDFSACDSLKTRKLFHILKKSNNELLYIDYIMGNISKKEIFKKLPDFETMINNSVIRAKFGKDSFEYILKKVENSMKISNAKKIHILLGGPPCQPYSLIGRARDPNRMQDDCRHFLYTYYLKILEYLQPDIFLYENVPGLFSARSKGERIFQRIIDDFSSLKPAYDITPPLEKLYKNQYDYILDCVDFNVPQHRKRIFLIGYKRSIIKKNPRIMNLFSNLQAIAIENRLKGYNTVDDAIGDLPVLTQGSGSDTWLGKYTKFEKLKNYQIEMRKESKGVLNHRARPHMESDLERYKFFIELHRNGKKSVNLKDLLIERPDLTPNHKHLDKFMDRFKVQWWSTPASTITSHISKDGHYYIHPDIHQCRSFTVREAARCQSFPDNYVFEGSRTQQFIQVGNAVPPLLAFEIGKLIYEELKDIYA